MVIGLTALFGACEPGITVHYDNGTHELLMADVNGRGRVTIDPMAETGVGYTLVSGDEFNLILTDDMNCIVQELRTTVDDLSDEDYRIVIDPTKIPPRSERECPPQ